MNEMKWNCPERIYYIGANQIKINYDLHNMTN